MVAICLQTLAQVQITLPPAIYTETFDSVEEGQLPAGWTVLNFTDEGSPGIDLASPHSDSFKDWVLISRTRVEEIGAAGGFDAARRLRVAPNQFVNGVLVTNLVEGKFMYAESDVRGGSQVQFLFSPDFNLAGKTNVHIFFHSIYEQNQDSLGAVEYSVDSGATWLPVVYMVDKDDILRTAEGNVDAFATLNEARTDAAAYVDPVSGEARGGSYGAFIGAATNIWPTLGAYISPRVNDDPVESKRVELFRIPAADNQAKVRFRFAQAGTASWYFGIDNFGLYSIAAAEGPLRPTISAPAQVSFLSDVTLTGSAFQGRVATQTHGSSVWQISAAPAFSVDLGFGSVLETVRTTGPLTSVTPRLTRIYPGGTYYATVQYIDATGAKSQFAEPVAFAISVLPQPLIIENFESTAAGSVPAGWTVANQTDGASGASDPADLNSDTYLDWTVVTFEGMQAFGGSRVNNTNVISGNSIYAESDNRGGNQIQYLTSPDFNLSGKNNIWLVFKSNYLQNQDSFGGLEYSVDGGATWLPLLYMIDRGDVIFNADGSVNAGATLTTTYGDVAKVIDPATGERVAAGKYGDFILAKPLEALGPFISDRVNDDATESKRIERFRLTAADNQAKVRLRFAHAGTGSWYWGVDDVTLFSAEGPAVPVITAQPQNVTVTAGANVTLSVTASGATSYQWKRNGADLTGATISTLSLSSVTSAQAGTYTVVVSNAAGSVTSAAALLTVNDPVPPPLPALAFSQWDFNGDLAGTVGQGLTFRGDTAASATFSTVTIGGQPARVMRFPAATASQGFVMDHGLGANGGGTNVNQYTLIMDVMFADDGHGKWRGLFQTDPSNSNDGDLFINPNNGIGISGQYQGTVQANTWHRIAFAVDLTQKTLGKYIDGALVNLQTLSDTSGGVDQRWSLQKTALLFTDEDGETAPGFVNSVQIVNRRLSDAEVASLGGASASGIRPPDVVGQWDFDGGNLAATVASALEFRGDTSDSTTFSASMIGGQEARVMSYPAASATQGFKLTRGGGGNGGGTNLNQYTLIMDVMFPAASDAKWRGLLQTDPGNGNDGDLFVNPANGIGISGQYQGTVQANTWHRLAFAFDLTQKTLGKYVDGKLVNLQTLSDTSGGVDQRWSLQSSALLFTDEDNETAAGVVNSVQLRARRLSDAEISALGGASASGIPLNIPSQQGGGDIKVAKVSANGRILTIEWTGGTGPFLVERKNSVTDGNWLPVASTTERSVMTAMIGSAGFYRVTGNATTAVVTFSASLSGAAERPTSVTTSGSGSGIFALEGDKLHFAVSYSGLSGAASAAHIHGPALASEPAGVLINLAPFNGGGFGASGTLSGTVTLTAEQKVALLAGKTYVNIHTGANPGGEIRGQIANAQLGVILTGAAERPAAVTTAGSGKGTLVLLGNQLVFDIEYSGLSAAASAAHIHGPGTTEQAVGVMVNLAPFNGGAFGVSGRLAGTVALTPEQLAAVLDGLAYVNIHTSTNPTGEIRGQIAQTQFKATLSGAAERPAPVNTPGTGSGVMTLIGNQLNFHITYGGLTAAASASHIHGPATMEQAAGVLINLAPFNGGSFGVSGTLIGSVTLTQEQLAAVTAGLTYVNIHSSTSPSGEIRGQIVP